MTVKNFIQGFLPGTDSPGKIYELFRGLGYPGDKVLDPTYQKKIEEFELGINSNRPIREQKPNPLPDRKALDDIVFDILGLTQEERDEVYRSVCELVKNRLEGAGGV